MAIFTVVILLSVRSYGEAEFWFAAFKVVAIVPGAESGSVPVSAVAPAMLFSEMEVQKRAHSHERPPILPPPGFETKTANLQGDPAKQAVKP